MSIYLISLVQQRPDHDYGALRQAIAAATGMLATETAWLVDVAPPLETVNSAVLSHLSPDDRVIVVELAGGIRWAATNLLSEADTWLKQRQG